MYYTSAKFTPQFFLIRKIYAHKIYSIQMLLWNFPPWKFPLHVYDYDLHALATTATALKCIIETIKA